MSWFNKRPTTKTPPKAHPHHSSPTTDKLLKESKERVRATPKKSKKD